MRGGTPYRPSPSRHPSHLGSTTSPRSILNRFLEAQRQTQSCANGGKKHAPWDNCGHIADLQFKTRRSRRPCRCGPAVGRCGIPLKTQFFYSTGDVVDCLVLPARVDTMAGTMEEKLANFPRAWSMQMVKQILRHEWPWSTPANSESRELRDDKVAELLNFAVVWTLMLSIVIGAACTLGGPEVRRSCKTFGLQVPLLMGYQTTEKG